MASFQKVQKISEAQLKDEVLKWLGFAAFLTVHRHNPPLNYTVGIVTAPAQVVAAQGVVDKIVEELRPQYELAD